MTMTSNGTMNGYQQSSGLWLPPSIRRLEHQVATQARRTPPSTTGRAGSQPAPTTAPTPDRPTKQSTAAGNTAPRSEAQAQPPAAGPVRTAPTPEEVRQRYEQSWKEEEVRIRSAATDKVSNGLGWLVAVLAGLLSLEGFRLFGQLLQWPAIGTVPWTDVAISPLVTLWFTIDVIAFVAMQQWLNPAFSKQTRALGMRVSVAALGISVLINAIGHWFHGGPYAWAAVPAAALPPALLWAVLYLRDRRVRDLHQQLAEARERHEKALEQALAPVARPAATANRSKTMSKPRKNTSTTSTSASATNTRSSKPSTDSRTDEELVSALVALDQQHGRRVGQHIALNQLSIGRARFDRIRRMADQHSSQTTDTNPDA